MDYAELEHLAHEAFIRRAAALDLPFMLKGSYVTRQYFPKEMVRKPADLDWVYLEHLDDPASAAEIFDAWMIAVTETDLGDGVRFTSFRENRFWRMIDYAMADDFPTVNTDLTCNIAGSEQEMLLRIDVSFNLDIEQAPVPLLYRTDAGAAFEVPLTVPLSLQVSWKIHQSLVRPRFKDFFDLQYLVAHPDFTPETRAHMLLALVNECAADRIGPQRLEQFLRYDFRSLFPRNNAEDLWTQWRFGMQPYSYIEASDITDLSLLPESLAVFFEGVAKALKQSGIGPELIPGLPTATRLPRKPEPIPATRPALEIRQIPSLDAARDASLPTSKSAETSTGSLLNRIRRWISGL